MLDLNNLEVRFALHAVRQASQLVRTIQAEMVTPALTKTDRSPVTVADFAAQALVARLLAQAYPGAALVGEESAAALKNPSAAETLARVTEYVARFIPGTQQNDVLDWIDRGGGAVAGTFWTLDPIDGTKGFLRGDQYAIALALVEEGQVQVGVLGCPNLRQASIPDVGGPGSLVAAQRGRGTWYISLQDELSEEHFTRLQVSDEQQPAQARVLRSFESGHTNVDQIEMLTSALEVQAAPVRMDSQAKYAVLAAGGGEVIIRLLSPDQPDYREKIWDQAAGSLVLEEAGGQISDLSGKALDFTAGRSLDHNRGVLATNRALHPALLKGLSAIGV